MLRIKGSATPLACMAISAACLMAAGCSSSPSAQAQAQAQRAVVFPVAKRLYTQLTGAGIGYISTIIGGYYVCDPDDPTATAISYSSVQYSAEELMTPFSRNFPYATFRRQVVEALNANGWKLRPGTGSSRDASYYNGHLDGANLRLIETDSENPGLGPSADLFVSGDCFNAGSSALQLGKQGQVDYINEPRPTATPSAGR